MCNDDAMQVTIGDYKYSLVMIMRFEDTCNRKPGRIIHKGDLPPYRLSLNACALAQAPQKRCSRTYPTSGKGRSIHAMRHMAAESFERVRIMHIGAP